MNSSGGLIDPIHVNNQSMTWFLSNCFALCYASWLVQDVPADKNVQANFAPEGDYWLNVNVIGQGLYELDPPGPYYDTQVVKVSFTPSAGHQFSTKPDAPPASAGEELAGWAFDHWSYQPTSSFSDQPDLSGTGESRQHHHQRGHHHLRHVPGERHHVPSHGHPGAAVGCSAEGHCPKHVVGLDGFDRQPARRDAEQGRESAGRHPQSLPAVGTGGRRVVSGLRPHHDARIRGPGRQHGMERDLPGRLVPEALGDAHRPANVG